MARHRNIRCLAAFAVTFALGACGTGPETRGDQPSPTTTYSNEVDGIAVTYPASWHRADLPLAGAPTGTVEILGLATSTPPNAEEGCSPYPWTTMKALAEGDLVLTLRAGMFRVGRGGSGTATGARPSDVMALPETTSAELPGGCGVAGVRQWSADFLEHGWQYTAFLTVRGDLTAEREEALRAVWSSLRLDPIVEPDGEATIGQAYWHVLHTHCGIEATNFNGRDWVADPPMVEGAGSPPPGWHNPFEAGLIALIESDRAEFRSRSGDRVATFRPRTPEDPPVPLCA